MSAGESEKKNGRVMRLYGFPFGSLHTRAATDTPLTDGQISRFASVPLLELACFWGS